MLETGPACLPAREQFDSRHHLFAARISSNPISVFAGAAGERTRNKAQITPTRIFDDNEIN
jgi:hypothetical protein